MFSAKEEMAVWLAAFIPRGAFDLLELADQDHAHHWHQQ